MLLVDLSGVMVTSTTGAFSRIEGFEVTPESIFLTSLNRIVDYHKLNWNQALAICYDSKPYWRMEIFPHYKANRKQRDERPGSFPWGTYRQHSKQAFEYFLECGYPIVGYPGAEGDDVMYALATKITSEPHIIISSDKDLCLTKRVNPDVRQYSIMKSEFLEDMPDILTHVLKGDFGDGIPNVFSTSDHFVKENKTRQKSISKIMINEFRENGISLTAKAYGVLERLNENATLIDPSRVPEEIVDGIIETYIQEVQLNKTHEKTQNVLSTILEGLDEDTEIFTQSNMLLDLYYKQL